MVLIPLRGVKQGLLHICKLKVKLVSVYFHMTD